MSRLIGQLKITPITLGLLTVIFLSNAIRFLGLEYSPPDFYVDEAAGATQALCILESATDFFGSHLPLFVQGVGDAFYSPTYLYGQVIWSGIFGKSIFVFRAFIAFISCLSILFLFLFVKDVAGQKVALYVALAGSIMPWSFHFSRIAWDPPVGVFFLITALWACYRFRNSLITSLLFSLAAYSYSPLRIAVPIICIFLPNIQKKEKFLVCIWGAIFAIPLLIQMQIPEFTARSESISLWGSYSSNQFKDLNFWQLTFIAIKQFFLHFSPDFLFMTGDKNIRHSIQTFGELSWLDLSAYIGGAITLLYLVKEKSSNILSVQERRLLAIAVLGIIANTIPAALTNQGVPHALRSLGCWPFYAIITGCSLNFISRVVSERIVVISTISIGSIFFSAYLFHFFINYPDVAKNYFSRDTSKINKAFDLISSNGWLCKDVPKLADELLEIKLNEAILFSSSGYGALYFLGENWESPEPWGIWAKPNGAKLRLVNVPPNAKSIAFALKAIITPSHQNQSVEISINGREPKTFNLNNAGENLIEMMLDPSDLKDNKILWIEIFSTNPVTPIQAGISQDDNRLLGVGLLSVTLR